MKAKLELDTQCYKFNIVCCLFDTVFMAHVKSVIDFKLFYNPLPDTKHNNIKSILIIEFAQTDQ